MEWATMEQEISASRNEIIELKQKLDARDENIHQMESDRNFHMLKSQELQDVLDSRGATELRSKLEVKALQNTELTIQVQELRYQLHGAAQKTAEVELELKKSSQRIQKLTEDRKSSQRMLVEMSDVVRLLGQIEVDYVQEEDQVSTPNTPLASLDNIKRKIDAIEKDRKQFIKEHQRLQTVAFEKELEIKELIEQLSQFEFVQGDRKRLLEDNKRLTLECEEKDMEIARLKDALRQDQKRSSGLPTSVSCSEHGPDLQECVSATDPAMEVQLQSDGTTMVLETPDTPISKLTDDLNINGDDDNSSLLSFESLQHSGEGEGQQTSLKQRVSSLLYKLHRSQQQAKSAKKKQELREKLLRDVIFQYKELQKEHDETLTRVEAMQRTMKIKGFQDLSDVGKGNRKSQRGNKHEKSQNDRGPIEESSTFETTELSAEANARELSSIEVEYFDPTAMESQYRRLEKECARLEHEYDDAVARIANLEEDLSEAKEQLSHASWVNDQKDDEIRQLQNQCDHLQDSLDSAQGQSALLERALESSKKQAQDAQVVQQQREQDLWDAINQYKKLESENEITKTKMLGVECQLGETRAEMANVTQELSIAKRYTQRRDLVCQFRKMEQELAETNRTVESLKADLRLAQSSAAKAKEDTKCTKMRLKGCHFQFKQLQSQYDNMVAQKVDAERKFSRAERHLKVYEKLQASWSDKLSHVREKRNGTEKEKEMLRAENENLKSQCNDLLQLASKSIEAL